MPISARRLSRSLNSIASPGGGTPTLAKTVLVSDLACPWDVTFLSDGTMFFTERIGHMSVRETNGTVRETTTLADGNDQIWKVVPS